MSFVAKGTCFTVSVREFLDNIYSKAGLKQGSAAELKSLCLGLFEALNDKSIALQHQRKTNQYVCLFFSCPMLWTLLFFFKCYFSRVAYIIMNRGMLSKLHIHSP